MKLTLRDVLNLLFRYSRALVTFWAVILIASLVFYSQTQKVYESKAKILISLGTEALGKAGYLSNRNLQLQQREEEIHNEQQIMKSNEVMLIAAKWILGESTAGLPSTVPDWRVKEAKRFLTGVEPPSTLLLRLVKTAAEEIGKIAGPAPKNAGQLDNNIARELSDGLSVKLIYDSDSLDVSYTARDPRVAQTLLQLLIAAYLEHHIAVFQSNQEADLLKAQLESSLGKYHDRLGEFSSFMNAHGVYNDDSQVNVLLERREKLKQELNEVSASADAVAAQLASLKGIEQSLQQFERYSTTEARNKQRDTLLAKIDDAALEEQTLLARHPKGSRAYEEQQSKLSELRHLLEAEPAQVVEQTEQRRSKASETVESAIINFSTTQRGDQIRIARLQDDLKTLDDQISDYATNLKGFNSLRLNLSFAKQESEQLAQVYMESRLKTLTSQNAITDISVIDIPTWDPEPASPKKKIAIAATLLLLLMGSFAVLLACGSLDTTMADPGTVEVQLGLPVAGSIPLIRGGTTVKDFRDLFTLENQREFARIYQSMRDRGAEGKIILLAESNAKEGASLLGYGLARFLSLYAREKTIFIDGTTHPITESANLSHGPAANESAVLAWPGAEQGAAYDNGSDAASVLSKLKTEFSYVVVAVGAAKDATDLLTISGIVSAVLFVVEAGKTRRWAARYNLDLLQRYGFQDIRLILNKRKFYIPGWLMRFV